MRTLCLAGLLVLSVVVPALAADGVIDIPSDFSVGETADRLAGILQEQGMTVFDRIDHAQGADEVGIELPDTELIIFGNPKVGTPLMKCQRSVAIDLPQKALVWKDADGKVWISYNDAGYLQKRHDISGCEDILSKVEKALSGMLGAAAGGGKP